MSGKIAFTVFTKPWKMPLAELAGHVHDLGFDGVELPVRPGFQVEPGDVARALPEAAKILADGGVRIASVAAPTDEPTIAACAAAGVPLIRICAEMDHSAGYLAAEAELQRQFDGLVGPLATHGVTVGVQNHCGRGLTSAMALRHLVEKYDPAHVAAVLDFGHSGLAGEAPDVAIDTLWSHLALVNFKSALWHRGRDGRWTSRWVAGPDGMADWPAAVEALKRRNYAGDVCLTAEYSDADRVDRLVAADLACIKPLFA